MLDEIFSNQILFGLLGSIILELIIEAVSRKSVPFLLEPYFALVKQTKYLFKTIKRPRFFRWLDKYVELEVLEKKALTYNNTPQLVQFILGKNLSLNGSCPFVLIGDPGSGKTTTLEAIASQTASKVLKRQIFNFGTLFFVILATYENFFTLLIGLIFYGLIYRYLLQGIIFIQSLKEIIAEKILRLPPKTTVPLIPIFIDARSGYAGENIREWCLNFAKNNLGMNKLRFNQYDGIAWIIDGTNEISATLYPTFIEGWREILRDSPSMPIVFSSRVDQNPTRRLGIENYLSLCPLNNLAIKKFIKISQSSKSSSKESFLLEKNLDSDFQELVKNGLLGENGIGRNPYWLSMILDSDFYTLNKGKLLTKFIKELLTREIKEKPEERKRKSNWKSIVPIKLEMYALSELAYSMHDDGLVGFGNENGWEKARNIIKHCIKGTPYTVEDVLEEAVASSLLVTRFRKRIEFVHQLVQEFFVAFYLNNMINNSSFDSPLASITTILGESLMHKDMNEIIIMLIGISDSQMLIAEWLANQIIEKRHKSSISLLKRCIEIVYETTDADVSKEFVDILLGSMRDPDIHIRWDTVVILGEIKNANALEPLIIDLLEPSRFSRQKIRKVIERSKHPPRNKLIALLKHPNSLVRRNTIEILERINDDWVIEPIVSVLKDNDPNVRWQAVYTLGKIGNKRVLKELENIAVKDDTVAHSKFRIANTALEAIWKIQNRLDKRTFEI